MRHFHSTNQQDLLLEKRKKKDILVPHLAFRARFLHFGRYKMHLIVYNGSYVIFFLSSSLTPFP